MLLVPLIMYVQRLVRMLRDHGKEPEKVLADPEGLLRWYIRTEFSLPEDEQVKLMLLQAYRMRCLVILIDGVDEAAGLRNLVEAFVHYELVPSGNRLVVTSRPEGVDLEDYKHRFIVMDLLKLTDQQQRAVIQMQLKGNRFFEHLVNIAKCRKEMDEKYIKCFPTEQVRNDLAAIKARPISQATAGMSIAPAGFERANRARGLERANTKSFKNQSFKNLLGRPVQSEHLRDLHVDSQRLRHLHSKLAAPCGDSSLLEEVERRLDTFLVGSVPNTYSALEQVIVKVERELALETTMPSLVKDVLVHLARTSRAIPYVSGRDSLVIGQRQESLTSLWKKVVAHTDKMFTELERPGHQLLQHLIGVIAATSGVPQYALQKNSSESTEGRIVWKMQSAQKKPELVYRNPVELWLQSSEDVLKRLDRSEAWPGERGSPPWCAMTTLLVESEEQCIKLLRQLTNGLEEPIAADIVAKLTTRHVQNFFLDHTAHPTRMRYAACHVCLEVVGGSSMDVLKLGLLVKVEHQDLNAHFHKSRIQQQYNYFWNRAPLMSQHDFDFKLEEILVFLVEAIGVPVLLSLLLLAFSDQKSAYLIDLHKMPTDRKQLYARGVRSGIHARMKSVDRRDDQEVAVSVDSPDGAGATRKMKRMATKALLEIIKDETGNATNAKRGLSSGPAIDLSSIRKGKKIASIVGEERVVEFYCGLCSRIQPCLVIRPVIPTVHVTVARAVLLYYPQLHASRFLMKFSVALTCVPPSRNM